jgi:hypothetical protein
MAITKRSELEVFQDNVHGWAMEALAGLEWVDTHVRARRSCDDEALMFRLVDLRRALEHMAEVATPEEAAEAPNTQSLASRKSGEVHDPREACGSSTSEAPDAE